jgi:hypothetical protein
LVSQLKSENEKLKNSNNTTTWQYEVGYRLIL